MTSKGEGHQCLVIINNEGYSYRLVAYRNLVTKEQYSVESIQREIKAENRIGTLKVMQEEIEALEPIEKELIKDKIQKKVSQLSRKL